MNTTKESEKADDPREAQSRAESAEPFVPEASGPKETSETRDMAERGYGWGV